MIIIIFMEYIIAKVAEVSRRILQCHCATGENSMKRTDPLQLWQETGNKITM